MKTDTFEEQQIDRPQLDYWGVPDGGTSYSYFIMAAFIIIGWIYRKIYND